MFVLCSSPCMAKTGPRTAHVVLRLLRVRENAAGHLDVVPTPDLAPDRVSEAWWDCVLRDGRVRPPRRGQRFDTLGLCVSESIAIVCAACNLRRAFATADLLRRFGRAYYMTYLRYDLVDCPRGRRFRDCAVRYDNARQ